MASPFQSQQPTRPMTPGTPMPMTPGTPMSPATSMHMTPGTPRSPGTSMHMTPGTPRSMTPRTSTTSQRENLTLRTLKGSKEGIKDPKELWGDIRKIVHRRGKGIRLLKAFDLDTKVTKTKAGRKRFPSRYRQAIDVETRNKLKSSVRLFTLPGKGFIDLSNDNQQFSDAFRDSCSEDEYRKNYLNAFLRATKSLACFVHGLFVSLEMLEFDNARRTVLSLNQAGVFVGVKMENDAPTPVDVNYSNVNSTDTKVTFDPKVTESGNEDVGVKDTILTDIRDLGVSLIMWPVKFHICFLLSRTEIKNSCTELAHFALNCQEHGIVTVLSLELSQNPDLSLEEAGHVLKDILSTLAKTLQEFSVYIEGVILAINPLSPGVKKIKMLSGGQQPIYHPERVEDEDVFTLKPVEERRAKVTAQALHQCLPPRIGIVMTNYPSTPLSEINKVLNAINQCPVARFTFNVGFCYTHVVQDGFMSTWGGEEKNWKLACQKLVTKAQMCTDATLGSHYATGTSSFFITREPLLDVNIRRWNLPIDNTKPWDMNQKRRKPMPDVSEDNFLHIQDSKCLAFSFFKDP